MDLQQILALLLVAAAAVWLAFRLLRKRRHRLPECADCAQSAGHDEYASPGDNPSRPSPGSR